ncbi:MAG TPA: RsmE family RNA methyltransferase [Elusimicrobiota bacterium]|nr:RsmE family RNA methyltransferase [Elusimicrobiota bacterium]
MPHFFVDPEKVVAGRFELGPGESRHVVRVLRLKAGAVVNLFDGKGRRYEGRIDSIQGPTVRGVLIPAQSRPSETHDVRLHLWPAIPKGDALEWMLEKLTEIGVSAVHPIVTERTVARIPSDRIAQRLQRWGRIVTAAAKQSGRADLPEVSAPCSLAEALIRCGAEPKIMPWEGENTLTIVRAFDRFRPEFSEGRSSSLHVFIGPEGGFSLPEVRSMRQAGGLPVTLGQRILRVGTAALYAASILYNEIEESKGDLR